LRHRTLLFRLLLLALILGSFGLRLYGLAHQDIWWDEARNIDVALRPFGQVATAPELDIQPPVYFWLLHLWGRLMNLQVGFEPQVIASTARYLSVAAGMAGLAILYQLVRRMASRQAGLFALLLAGVSPLWLAESQETRMYTLSFALLLGAALALMNEELRMKNEEGAPPSNSRRSLIHYSSFILLSSLALLTHYNAVFILVAWYGWWGVTALLGPDRWRRLRVVVLCGLAMTLLVSPILPIALRQIPTYANPNLVAPTLAQYLEQNWIGFLGGYAWDGVTVGDWWLWAVLILFLVGLVLGVRAGGWRSQTFHLSFLLAWLVGGLALYYIAVVDRGAFNIRYSSFVTPALYALLGVALVGLGKLHRWLPGVGMALLLAGLIPAAHAELTDPHFFREDTAGLVRWLRAQTGPGDIIFVDQKYPFGFYYERYAIDPAAQPVGDEAAPARYLFVDINTIDRQMNEWAGEARRVYWVQWFESDTDPRGSVSFLLDKHGEWAGETHFRGYWVQWWQLSPPTGFVLAEELRPQLHRWRHGLASVEASVPRRAVPGESLPVVIRWQRTTHEPVRPLKARVALYNAEGGRVLQDDRRLLNDRHLAPGEWAPDDQPLNVYWLPLPEDLPPGEYKVRLLLYDAETLDPVELIDEAGNPAGFEPAIGAGVQVAE
jgi:mannosyltransferase